MIKKRTKPKDQSALFLVQITCRFNAHFSWVLYFLPFTSSIITDQSELDFTLFYKKFFVQKMYKNWCSFKFYNFRDIQLEVDLK